jgi:hypothetical protein
MPQRWLAKLQDRAVQIHSGLLFSVTGGVVEQFIRLFMFSHDGRLRTTRFLPWFFRRPIGNYYAYRDWPQIALIVANQYPGGDYFEFGSDGFRTFRNFLSAFHLNRQPERFPDTKFFAFDIFGEPKPGSQLTAVERPYFDVYRGLGEYHYRTSEKRLRRHGLLLDRCVIVKGHFEDTLNDEFKARLRAENRRVGFAFLDCNIPSSYKTCFDFLRDFVREDRAFIYIDEYFQMNEVPGLFDEFCAAVKDRFGLRAHYIRNSGAFGALFILMQETKE